MIYGATGAACPRGRIRDIRFGPGIPRHEFIVRARYPGRELHFPDPGRPTCRRRRRQSSQGLCCCWAPGPLPLEDARRAVEIKTSRCRQFSHQDSLNRRQAIWGEDYLQAVPRGKGNVDAAWDDAYLIVEGEYSPAQELPTSRTTA
jgi:hypothetical protein